MFRSVRRVFRKHGTAAARTPRRGRPAVEALEGRLVPSASPGVTPPTDYWIAPAGPSASWTDPANWSLGAPPQAGQDVAFDQHSSTPCIIPADVAGLALHALTFGDFAGTVTDEAPALDVGALTLHARSTAGQELIIDAGALLRASQGFTFLGGEVSGGGVLEADGLTTINGASASDRPTLACQLDVGSGSRSGTLLFASAETQPLVVTGNGDITVSGAASAVQINTLLVGQEDMATAVSDGDGQAHTLRLTGGASLSRVDNGACLLGMGLVLDPSAGSITISPPASDSAFAAGPLDFTGLNADGRGLSMMGGTLAIGAGLAFDHGASIGGGVVKVARAAKLTLGTAESSPASVLSGGTLALRGTLFAHGGFSMAGGMLTTQGSPGSIIRLDPGTLFELDGGAVDVTPPGQATGTLTIDGNMLAEGGTILDNVSSAQGSFHSGLLRVNGDLTLQGTALRSADLAQPTVPFPHHTYALVSVSGQRTGDFTSSGIPATWAEVWVNGVLEVSEK
jgi:hypothetical protein